MPLQSRTVLQKVLTVMNDGEPRTIRRAAYLANVSLNAVRQAVREGHLDKVGEEPKPGPWARCGQAIVQLPIPKEKRCRRPNPTPMAA